MINQHPPRISVQEIHDTYTALLARSCATTDELEQYMLDIDQRESRVGETYARSYIHQSCDTTDTAKKELYMYYVQDVMPILSEYDDQINRKLMDTGLLQTLPSIYTNIVRTITTNIALFRAENIPLSTRDEELGTQYGDITSNLSIIYNDETLTMPQAAGKLEGYDRDIRQAVHILMKDERKKHSLTIDTILDQLIETRLEMSVNAGYTSYIDYIFTAKHRYDYSQKDVFAYHDAVATHITPLLNLLHTQRRQKMGVETLKPRDTAVDIEGTTVLMPYETISEFVDKTIQCLDKVDKIFGDNIRTMQELELLDLDSRPGKRPGGYNYPLMMSRKPFIFMNGANTHSDVETMIHEAGHATHSFATAVWPHAGMRDVGAPSEMCEVASMAMELFTMNHRDVFYTNPDDLRRAKLQKVSGEIYTLCRVACVDAFQYRLYTTPGHSHDERHQAWKDIYTRFMGDVIDWSDDEERAGMLYQRQLHIFEHPFYYIEYGIAGLASLRLWGLYQQDPVQTIRKYKEMLALGYTVSLPELYCTAGIDFAFDDAVIAGLSRDIMAFVLQESRGVSI